MASYQIPQFLDSGDKIIFGMNLRQFGYALGAALTSVLIFSLVNQASPGVGFYAIIPCLPVIGVGAYLALGRFNGRDSEIYVLKFLLYNTKPKAMVYTRFPVLDDLNDKLATLNYNAILKTWTDRINTQKAKDKNAFIDFSQQGSKDKIRQIQSLKEIVDKNPLNAMQIVLTKEQELARTQQIINNAIQAKRNTPFRNNPILQQPFNPFPVQPEVIADTSDPTIPTQDATQANFFDK